MTYRSIRSAAGELGISQLTVRRAIRQGRIPAVEVGGVWRIPPSYFEELEARAYSRVVPAGGIVPQPNEPVGRHCGRHQSWVGDELPEDALDESEGIPGAGFGGDS